MGEKIAIGRFLGGQKKEKKEERRLFGEDEMDKKMKIKVQDNFFRGTHKKR
jgi:hypothetical protein